MCPWVGPHAPSFRRQLWGLPSRVKYLSPHGVLLPLVYGTTASPLWLELRRHSAWQVTPSWTVYRLACHQLLPWLRVTFAMVPDAAWPGSDQWPWSTAPATGPVGRLGRPSVSEEWLVEEAETSPCSRKVRMRSLPRPRHPGGATWTRMTTWTFLRHGGFPPKTSSQTAHNARFLEGQPREWNPYKKITPL